MAATVTLRAPLGALLLKQTQNPVPFISLPTWGVGTMLLVWSSCRLPSPVAWGTRASWPSASASLASMLAPGKQNVWRR